MRHRFFVVVFLQYPWGETVPQAEGAFRFLWTARLWRRIYGSALNRGLRREGRDAHATVVARITCGDLDALERAECAE